MFFSHVGLCFPVLGLFGLKKAKIASPFFLPLIVSLQQEEMARLRRLDLSFLDSYLQIISVLFSFYIRKQHFRVARFLPTRNCLREDERRDEMDMSFLVGAYLQPELAAPRRVAISDPYTANETHSGSRGDYQALG